MAIKQQVKAVDDDGESEGDHSPGDAAPEKHQNDGDEEDSANSDEGEAIAGRGESDEEEEEDFDEDGGAEEEEEDEEEKEKKRKRKERQKEKLLKEIAKAKKQGVCYLSRIPPHLKPLKLRHLLSQYGEVLRIYLAPEDHAVKLRRKLAGKKSGKNFTEGWVEFAKKSVAKRVAKLLNGEPMGGKRHSAHYYDLWNIKYLTKFKWDNLTEEIAYKNATREQKLAAEISAAKRERDFYLSKVNESKAISAMEQRKRKRIEGENNTSLGAEGKQGNGSSAAPRIVRHFPQKKSVRGSGIETAPRLSNDVLAGVFGR